MIAHGEAETHDAKAHQPDDEHEGSSDEELKHEGRAAGSLRGFN